MTSISDPATRRHPLAPPPALFLDACIAATRCARLEGQPWYVIADGDGYTHVDGDDLACYYPGVEPLHTAGLCCSCGDPSPAALCQACVESCEVLV